MNSQDAKRLLGMLRPGEADRTDPHFAEALRQAESDPELRQWLAEQKQFDSAFARALKDVPVPVDLRSAILAQRPQPKVIAPAFWLLRNWRMPAAAAAAVMIAASVAWAQWSKPVGFSEFRRELVKEAWGNEAHLDYKSTDLIRIRQWLASHGIEADVRLPAALEAMQVQVQGCQVVEAGGQRVPMLCLASGSKHLHLFVVEGAQLAGLPKAGSPDFERCGSWKTAAWQQGDRTYLLSGLKSHAFVNMFRKAGRWILWG
jgi:hypothetical protein